MLESFFSEAVTSKRIVSSEERSRSGCTSPISQRADSQTAVLHSNFQEDLEFFLNSNRVTANCRFVFGLYRINSSVAILEASPKFWIHKSLTVANCLTASLSHCPGLCRSHFFLFFYEKKSCARALSSFAPPQCCKDVILERQSRHRCAPLSRKIDSRHLEVLESWSGSTSGPVDQLSKTADRLIRRKRNVRVQGNGWLWPFDRSLAKRRGFISNFGSWEPTDHSVTL